MKLVRPLRPRLRADSRSGFTLMEMILVLLIITSLMGMVIFKMSTNVDDANITAAKGSLQALETTLLRYKMANGSLPTEAQGLEALTVPPPNAKMRQAFLKKDGINDPWGHVYQYRNPGRKSGGDFDIFSMGADGQPDTADDIGNW
ncbi:MAG: type II secretion system major pseudopilin GspG [Verrucomicrobiaceae bacterium]|nr:type II secretion system major pseudopilin GspG [Verrucomicrobiaceae bacterium]